jgi:hypothetical protein
MSADIKLKISQPVIKFNFKGVPSPGVPGASIEMQKSSTHIQWRVVGDTTWINLVALADITGAAGSNIELQSSGTYIQWRVVGGSWANLIALADLKGNKGDDGENIELQTSGGYIQWRVTGGSWANLVQVSTLKGDQGDPGAAATIEVGTVTTGVAGSSASAGNSGTPSAAVLDFTIPRGDKGDKGDAGSDGGSLGTKTIGTTGSGADYECDGTADNVQFALAISEITAGWTLIVLPGTYSLAATVTVNKAIRLCGVDKLLCIINIAGDYKGFLCTSRVEVKDISFTTTGQSAFVWTFETGGVGYPYPVVELYANYSRVSHCNFVFQGCAIFVHGRFQVISNNSFIGCNAICISWSDTFTNPAIGYIGDTPLQIFITDNIFGPENYAYIGVWLGTATSEIFMAGNHIQSIYGSVYAYQQSSMVHITNNTYSRLIAAGSGGFINSEISNNICFRNEVSINTQLIDCNVSDNNLYGASTDFIILQSGSTKNVISNNKGAGTVGTVPTGGITEQGTSDYNIIHDNSWCNVITRANSNSVDRNNI